MGRFKNHTSCPKCGSSDGNAAYEDGSTFCWVCQAYGHPDGVTTEDTQAHKENRSRRSMELLTREYASLPARKLDEETCKLWDYGVGQYRGSPVQIATYRTPDGIPCAQKIRTPQKDFVILGDWERAGLYGQHLWKDGGRKVVVTEGEVDALSVSKVQENRWPVVSIPNGAQSAKKALQKQLEWLEKFEEVILMFDMDEPGQRSARECAELFTPGKCKLANLPLKDANEMLKAGRGPEIINAIWNARTHRPDGIVSGTEIWERIIKPPDGASISYPWMGWNKALNGCRTGEIVTICAGSGQGKSTVVKELEYHFLMTEKETLGIIHLEENVERTSLGLIGLHLNQRVMNASEVEQEKLRKAYEETIGNGRVFLYDHWGSCDPEVLAAKVRYLVRGCGCTTIILDHVSIVVSGIEEGDERRLIDNLMTQLRSLVGELKCRLILVSHLKRPSQGSGHEEGARTSLAQLRGSAAIGQLSDAVVGLERDQQDPVKKNVVAARFLKNRLYGYTGVYSVLKFNDQTGRMEEVEFTETEDGDIDLTGMVEQSNTKSQTTTKEESAF